MKHPSSGHDANLVRRIFLTELFANVVGAPIAAAYGALMIDFSRLSVVDFVLRVLLIMAANQVLLALPLNVFLASRTRRGLAAWREGGLSEAESRQLFRMVSRLPFVQAALIVFRMFLCSAAVLALIASVFDSPWRVAATFSFAFYASFATGLFIYYYLHYAASRVAEEFAAGPLGEEFAARPVGRLTLADAMSNLPLILPTVITSVGIFFLILATKDDPGSFPFFAPRVVATLCLNLLTITPILVYSGRFHRKRLESIELALVDMIATGDISRRLPSDLGDRFALTALRINRAFDLFRLVLARLEAASGRLSETTMSFSAQVRETVASTTQQAAAVKEVVSTMEDSNRISGEIRDRARELSTSARESQDSVDSGFAKVQDTIGKMDEIKDANQRTLGEIGFVTEEISSIGEIIDIINGIANQTRIIAFNAELEATAAGEGGTSFRIVAEEIRRLANNTVDSLAGVKDRIAEIQQGSDRLLSSSEEGTAKIEEGLRLSADLNGIFKRVRIQAEATLSSATGIVDMIAGQVQAFEQIFMTLKQISEGADQVLASARISGVEVSNLQALVEELKAVLTRFRRGEDDPAAGAAIVGGGRR